MHAYVGFGANLGDPPATLAAVQDDLTRHGWRVLRRSPVYATDPWGGAEGGPFINVVWEIERRDAAADFLKLLQAIEAAHGRRRTTPNAARTCDLDLLFWGSECLDEPGLIVPHPRLAERRFVLAPLCDLIADAVHPRRGVTLRTLLETTSDRLKVRRVAGSPTTNLV